MYEIKVDKDKCTGCEECVGACPAGVFELADRPIAEQDGGKSKCYSDPVNEDECLGCETCVEVCEDAQAITITEC
ncbi:4Fe-4S binding protein [Desulfobulbus sp. TB]|nr:4Fe-4S binding protein [Desulfobulbus sp. TB]